MISYSFISKLIELYPAVHNNCLLFLYIAFNAQLVPSDVDEDITFQFNNTEITIPNGAIRNTEGKCLCKLSVLTNIIIF